MKAGEGTLVFLSLHSQCLLNAIHQPHHLSHWEILPHIHFFRPASKALGSSKSLSVVISSDMVIFVQGRRD